MPIPLIPILAIAGVSGSVIYLIHRHRTRDGGPQTALPSEAFSFQDRGFLVHVQEGADGRFRWAVWRDGTRMRSGSAMSKAEAISASVQWVSSRTLPPAKTVRQLPGPKRPPRKPKAQPTTPSEGASPTSSKTAPRAAPPRSQPPVPQPPVPQPTPPAPEPAPAPAPAPAPTPAEPVGASPVGMSPVGASPVGTVPPMPAGSERVARSGLRWEGNTVTLTDLEQYVADAFGSFEPFVDTPAEIVTKMLQGLLPELGVEDARELQIQLVGEEGEKVWIADAIEQVGRLQHQLFADDLDPQLVPFAADIVAEGIFDVEQRISGKRFAYRGRLIFARPSGGGYRWSIRDEVGVHGPSALVFPTPEAANRNAIAAISAVDEVAA